MPQEWESLRHAAFGGDQCGGALEVAIGRYDASAHEFCRAGGDSVLSAGISCGDLYGAGIDVDGEGSFGARDRGQWLV